MVEVHALDDYYLAITLLITIAYQLFFFSIAYSLKFDKLTGKDIRHCKHPHRTDTDAKSSQISPVERILSFWPSSPWHGRATIMLARSSRHCLLCCGAHGSPAFCCSGSSRRARMTVSMTRGTSSFPFLDFGCFKCSGFGPVCFLTRPQHEDMGKILTITIVSLPVTILNSPNVTKFEQPPFNTGRDIAGIVLFAIGFFLESVSDIQKYIFRSKPENKGKVCDVGLFTWSRHPNYFGEIIMQFGKPSRTHHPLSPY